MAVVPQLPTPSRYSHFHCRTVRGLQPSSHSGPRAICALYRQHLTATHALAAPHLAPCSSTRAHQHHLPSLHAVTAPHIAPCSSRSYQHRLTATYMTSVRRSSRHAPSCTLGVRHSLCRAVAGTDSSAGAPSKQGSSTTIAVTGNSAEAPGQQGSNSAEAPGQQGSNSAEAPGQQGSNSAEAPGQEGSNSAEAPGQQGSNSALEGLPLDLQLGPLPLMEQKFLVGGHVMTVITPQDVDDIMDYHAANGTDDGDPYWARVWPSAVALAELILSKPELVAGKRVADLGCGLGLAGIAAALAGASEVVLLDREPLALVCALLSARASLLPQSDDAQPPLPESSPTHPLPHDQHQEQQLQPQAHTSPPKGLTLIEKQRRPSSVTVLGPDLRSSDLLLSISGVADLVKMRETLGKHDMERGEQSTGSSGSERSSSSSSSSDSGCSSGVLGSDGNGVSSSSSSSSSSNSAYPGVNGGSRPRWPPSCKLTGQALWRFADPSVTIDLINSPGVNGAQDFENSNSSGGGSSSSSSSSSSGGSGSASVGINSIKGSCNPVLHVHALDWNNPTIPENPSSNPLVSGSSSSSSSTSKGRFDVVLACDVLYEDGFAEPIASLMPKLLRSSTESRLLLADPPNRTTHNRIRFLELMAEGPHLSNAAGSGGSNSRGQLRAAKPVVLSLQQCYQTKCDVTRLGDGQSIGNQETVAIQIAVFQEVVGGRTIGLKI